MSTNFAVTLTPNEFDQRTKAVTMSDGQWKLFVGLVDRVGCRLNVFAGLDRRSAAEFSRHLRRVVEREQLLDEDERAASDLLQFLAGPGVGGFALSRGFKKWNVA